MNPFDFVLADYYGDVSAKFGLDSAAVLLLQVMATGYTGTMPADSNPYRWVLAQLDQYGPNDFLKKLRADWNSQATR